MREGTASDAEIEELTLYADSRREVALSLSRAQHARELGGRWLVRASADKRIDAAHKAPLVVAERAVGSSLAVVGTIGLLFSPVFGVAALVGLGILGFSVLRVHVQGAVEDPYKEIEK